MARDYSNKRATDQYLAFLTDPSCLPFSFTYDGCEYKGFSPEHFQLNGTEVTREGDKETHRFTYGFSDVLSVTLAEVRCDGHALVAVVEVMYRLQ